MPVEISFLLIYVAGGYCLSATTFLKIVISLSGCSGKCNLNMSSDWSWHPSLIRRALGGCFACLAFSGIKSSCCVTWICPRCVRSVNFCSAEANASYSAHLGTGFPNPPLCSPHLAGTQGSPLSSCGDLVDAKPLLPRVLLILPTSCLVISVWSSTIQVESTERQRGTSSGQLIPCLRQLSLGGINTEAHNAREIFIKSILKRGLGEEALPILMWWMIANICNRRSDALRRVFKDNPKQRAFLLGLGCLCLPQKDQSLAYIQEKIQDWMAPGPEPVWQLLSSQRRWIGGGMTEAAEIMRGQIRQMWQVTSSSSREEGAFGRTERQQDERGEKRVLLKHNL